MSTSALAMSRRTARRPTSTLAIFDQIWHVVKMFTIQLVKLKMLGLNWQKSNMFMIFWTIFPNCFYLNFWKFNRRAIVLKSSNPSLYGHFGEHSRRPLRSWHVALSLCDSSLLSPFPKLTSNRTPKIINEESLSLRGQRPKVRIGFF